MITRFTIRNLLVAVLGLAVVFAVISPVLSRSKPLTSIEREIVDSINSRDKMCYLAVREHGFPHGTFFVLSVHVRCDDPDALIKTIARELDSLRRVDIHAAGTNLTDVGIAELKNVHSLRSLLVDETHVTESAIIDLKKHSRSVRVVHDLSNWHNE